MYLNQTSSWKIVKRDAHGVPIRNIYGEFEYIESTSKVRKQPYVKEIKDAEGRTIVTNHIIYTTDNIRVDDIVDGEVVLIESEMVSLVGNTVMKKVIT